VVLVGVLVAPVVLGRGSGVTHPCTQLLRYGARVYTRRPMPTPPLTERLAIGVGTLVGCAAPTNVNVRSLAGVASEKEIAVDGDAGSIYVARRS
jgi:hypothetical protein